MKIHEYQAIQLLEQAGVPVARGQAVFDVNATVDAFQKVAGPTAIAKVQALMGGRGKAGGVLRVNNTQEAQGFVKKFLGKPFSTSQSAGETKIVRAILFTQDKKILEEYYLAVTLDRSKSCPVILFSKQGGIEIEEVAAKDPGAVKKTYFFPDQLPSPEALLPLFKKQFAKESLAIQVADIASRLSRFFVEKDLSLCEINPLALTPQDKICALDAKMVFDDNALFRHEDIAKMKDLEEEDARERKAKEFGLNYVSMNGNIGCLVNGAGLAMATMDMIQLAGGQPANFLDVGGGATAEMVREGFKIILQDERVQAIFVHIFGGIAKCDIIAEGVVQASRETKLQVPLVVRLEGTHVEEGRAILKNSGLKIISCSDIHEAAQAAVREAKKYQESHGHSR